MNNISVIKENCYGCFSCFNICPNNAIDIKEDEEGFKYPSINKNHLLFQLHTQFLY